MFSKEWLFTRDKAIQTAGRQNAPSVKKGVVPVYPVRKPITIYATTIKIGTKSCKSNFSHFISKMKVIKNNVKVMLHQYLYKIFPSSASILRPMIADMLKNSILENNAII